MTQPDIETVWQRLRAHSGGTFTQIRGGEFTYSIDGTTLHPDRTNWSIPKAHIEEALGLVPLANTVPVQHLYGPSFLFALLMDERIRRDDW